MWLILLILLTAGNLWAGQGSTVIPDKVYPVGTYTFVSASLSKETLFQLTLSRAFWQDPGTQLTVKAEVSQDNGQTYCQPKVYCYQMTAVGGPASQSVVFVFRNTNAGTRRIRFTLIVSGGSIRTSGTFNAQ